MAERVSSSDSDRPETETNPPDEGADSNGTPHDPETGEIKEEGVAGGRITWHYVLHRQDLVFRTAFDEACAKVAEATGLPVYQGTPEQ